MIEFVDNRILFLIFNIAMFTAIWCLVSLGMDKFNNKPKHRHIWDNKNSKFGKQRIGKTYAGQCDGCGLVLHKNGKITDPWNNEVNK